MYYVYHIPNLKVGCTNNVKRRLNQQGHKSYELITETECIMQASITEIKTQKLYKFKTDINPYFYNRMKVHVTPQSITFSDVSNKQLLIQGLSLIVGKEIKLGKHTVTVNAEFINWVKRNSYESQFKGMGPYIYPKKLDQFMAKEETIETSEMFDLIRKWAKDKGILDKGDIKTQSLKLFEEAGELAKAVINEDNDEIKDAIGDAVVVLVSTAHFAGTTIEECIELAYNVIKKRTGKMQNGSFIKEI